MARHGILARLWELIGPPRVTRAEAVAIASAELERIGRGPGEKLSVSRFLRTWTVVLRPRNVRGGGAAVDREQALLIARAELARNGYAGRHQFIVWLERGVWNVQPLPTADHPDVISARFCATSGAFLGLYLEL